MKVLDRLPLSAGLDLVVADEGDGVLRPLPWSVGGARRARIGEGAAEAVVALLAEGSSRSGAFALTAWHHLPVTGERGFGVDQTNESVVVGEQAVVKWNLTAEPGPHPAPRALDTLRRHGFTGIPAPWGLLSWTGPGDTEPRLIATVDTLLPGAVDGWTWAVDDLRDAATGGSHERVRETGRRLGVLVGELHATFADDDVTPATPADVGGWEAGAERDLARALAVTTGAAQAVLAPRAAAIRGETRFAPSLVGTPMARGHGDLHVGQVLRSVVGSTTSYVVTDFDGNPVVPPAERVLPRPPAVDVAGLAQSVQHAALVLRRHEPHRSPAAVSAAADALEAAFLATYAETVADLGYPDLAQPSLVRAFRLQQVCREFSYAAQHLPRWSYVPEAALPALLSGAP